jgi:ribonuclease P protein component
MGKRIAINQNHLFLRAYRSKLCFVSPFVVTYVVKRKAGPLAIGITASRKIGNAVERNRARRVIKAAIGELLGDKDGSFDLVFVCRRAILSKKSTEIEPILRSHLRKAGVLI